jgi:hypothetical protein
MKGYIFDENLPTRLRFLPGLPVVPLAKIARNPSDSQIRTLKLVNVYDGFLEGIG